MRGMLAASTIDLISPSHVCAMRAFWVAVDFSLCGFSGIDAPPILLVFHPLGVQILFIYPASGKKEWSHIDTLTPMLRMMHITSAPIPLMTTSHMAQLYVRGSEKWSSWLGCCFAWKVNMNFDGQFTVSNMGCNTFEYCINTWAIQPTQCFHQSLWL